MHKTLKKETPKTGIARLLQLAGPKKHKLVVACLLSVVSSAARITPFFTIYYVIKELIFNYSTPSAIDSDKIVILIALTFASALIYGICAFTSSILSHKAAFDILYALRVALMNKLEKVPSGYFTGTTQGAIKKIISDDVEQIEVFVAHHIADTVASVTLPFFTLIYLFVMDWRLGLVTLLPMFISIGLLSSGLKNPKGAETQVAMHDSKEKMNGAIVEYIHGMPVIKIFNRTFNAFKKYEQSVSSFVDSIEDTTLFFSSRIAAYYVFFGAQLLFLLPAVILLIPRANSYESFLSIVFLFFLVGIGLREPMETMMERIISTKRITEGVSRIDKILSHPEIAFSAPPQIPQNYDISFENVSFAYNADQNYAIKDVSFKLSEGSVTGLVGPSGSGKSTIAQLLLRFYDLENGHIKIGGVDICNIAASQLNNMIAFVFQDSFLFHDTIENNIRMGNKAAPLEAVIRAAKNANIHEVITQLPNGYHTIIGEENAYLSGGEKQRIAIARVFLKDAPIVILDEATAYADAENETKIQQAFARLAVNKTVLVIAHRLKSIENSNQIIVVNQGEIESIGTHQQLMAQCQLYSDMVSANERRSHWTIKKGDSIYA